MSLCYSADGSCILAAGQSKHICIYHVGEKLLVKKFELTQNRSFDAMDEVISRRKMTEFGNLALVEDRDDPLGQQAIKLPGSRKGDKSSRAVRPEVRVASLQFSPTGRDFAAASTEGLLIYSLDSKMVFDPFELSEDVTPAAVRRAISEGECQKALLLALKLNERDLVRQSIEKIPHTEVELACTDLPTKYVERLTLFVAEEVESTPHVHFYAIWARQLLLKHGSHLRQRSSQVMPTLNLLHKNLLLKQKAISKVCDHNSYAIKFLLTVGKLKRTVIQSAGEAQESVSASASDESEEEEMEEEVEEELASNWVD